MEKITNKKLKLYFKDNLNAQRTISIDYPRDIYDDEEIKLAMDKIISSNVLETKTGPIVTKASAEVETIEKSPFNLNTAEA